VRIFRHFRPDREVSMYNGDCFSLLSQLHAKFVDLNVSSPLHCMGKEYETSTDYKDFIAIHEKLLPELLRVTKPGGSICWQVGFHVAKGSVTPLDYLVYSVFSKITELVLRNRIVWTFGHGLHCKKRFSGRHETILWFTKGDSYKFNLDAVRIAQRYPGKRSYKGENRGRPSGNPKGKNPGDVWEMPVVNANHVEKTEHPCQYPFALAQRLIRGLTNPNEVVLDPFFGSGTTAAAAINEKRRFVGSELSKRYYDIAYLRAKEANVGSLKYRPHDKPIFQPNPNTKVAQFPEEFEIKVI